MKMRVIAALAASMAVGSVVAASGQDILIFGDRQLHRRPGGR